LAKTIKFNGVKKEVLIEQILAHQEATSKQAEASSSAPVKEEKKVKKTKKVKKAVTPAKSNAAPAATK
jgi:transcription termination factor Rho